LKVVVLSRHARTAAAERGIERDWIERAALSPDWRTNDSTTAGAERRFVSIPEHSGRVLRAACMESDTEIRVITVFFDRKAKRPV